MVMPACACNSAPTISCIPTGCEVARRPTQVRTGQDGVAAASARGIARRATFARRPGRRVRVVRRVACVLLLWSALLVFPSAAATAGPLVAQVGLQDAGAGTAAGLWIARFVNYLALAATVGLLVVPVLRSPAGGPARAWAGLRRRAALAPAAWAVSSVLLAVFAASNAAARPLPEAIRPEVLTQFVATRFGTLLLVQAAVAAVVACVVGIWPHHRAASISALVLAVFGAGAPPLWGHARTNDLALLAVTNDWLHLLSVTVWAGGLACLGWLAVRRAHVDMAVTMARFSHLAGWALGVVLVTGVINTALGMDAPGQLFTTTWGRFAGAKLIMLATLAWLGYQQRRRVIPHLSGPNPSEVRHAFRRLAATELAVLVLAFVAATSMASGIPADAEAASRIQSVVTSLGDGQLNLTIDPAATGRNTLHVYVLDDTGRPRADADELTVTLVNDDRTVPADLFVAGPGHWTTPRLVMPAAGVWQVQITVDLPAGPATASAAVTIR